LNLPLKVTEAKLLAPVTFKVPLVVMLLPIVVLAPETR